MSAAKKQPINKANETGSSAEYSREVNQGPIYNGSSKHFPKVTQ